MNKNIKDIIKVFTITNSGNFFSLLFLIVIGKTLNTNQFSLATAIIGFVGLAGIVYAFLPSIISKYISKFSEKNVKNFYYHNLIKFLIITVSFSLLILILYNPIFKLLKFNSFSLLFLIVLMFFLNGLVNYNDGVILGKQFFLYHSQAVFIVNFTKLAALFIFLSFHLDVYFVLVSFVISYLATVIFQFFKLKKNFHLKNQFINKNFNIFTKDTYAIIFINLIIIFLLNSELVLSRHFLIESDSGIYNGIASIGKISFYLVNALAPIVIPKTVFLESKNQSAFKFILNLLTLILILTIFLSVFYLLFKDQFITLILNENFLELKNLIFIMNLNYSMLAASSILLNFLVVKINASKIAYCIFPLTLVLLLFNYEVTPLFMSVTMTLINFTLLMILLILVMLTNKNIKTI